MDTWRGIELTFKLMTMRRLRRQLGGTITNRTTKGFAVLLAFGCVAFGVVDVYFADKPTPGDNLSSAEAAVLTQNSGNSLYISIDPFGLLDNRVNWLLFALAFVVLVIVYKLADVVRSVIGWMVLGLAAYAAVVFACRDSSVPECERESSLYIVIGIFAGVVLSVVEWSAHHIVYPYMFVYRSSFELPFLPCTDFISSWLREPPRFFGYEGSLDAEGRPHGLGTWNDSARNGETLNGVWEHGQPTGPFRATEYGSGFTFRSLRVAYCQCRAEPLDEYWFQTVRHPDGARWGVCSVECSSAGRFFNHLPEVTPLSGPEAAKPLGCQWRDLGAVTDFEGAKPCNGKQIESAVLVDALRAKGAGSHASNVQFSVDEFAALGVSSLRRNDYVTVCGHYWKPSQPSAAWCIEQLIKLDDPELAGSRYPPTLVVTAGRDGVQISGYNAPSVYTAFERSTVSIEFVPVQVPSSAAEVPERYVVVSEQGIRNFVLSELMNEGEARELAAKQTLNWVLYKVKNGVYTEVDAGGIGLARPSIRRHIESKFGAVSAVVEPGSTGPNGDDPVLAGLSVRGPDGRRWRLNSEDGNYEAVIFMHGFNSPTSDALKRIAQLWALGDFPNHLHPFVFGWPGGKTSGYFNAKHVASQEPAMAQDFVDFIESLIEAGCRTIHILAHSLGAMLLFTALPLLTDFLLPAADGGGAVAASAAESAEALRREKPISRSPVEWLAEQLGWAPPLSAHPSVRGHLDLSDLSKHPRQPPRSGPKMRLATTLLLNPDASLNRFVKHDFAALRKLCDHITLYADHADGALAYSEFFNREHALGKHPFDLVHLTDQPPDSPMGSAPSSPRSHSDAARLSDAARRPPMAAPKAARSQDDGAILRPRRVVRGAPPMAPRGKRIMPLDLDVIDVSWMDNNVHEMRHNFFNLNRWMIDDIREIVMTQRRARLRTSRMTHRFTNVWSFLAAPNHVVNP
ncbi:hypothetical protein Ctob_003494 [Chrysochromulina tobinii]|uniref:Uncharacterized protein n=1 Tax=Chrysochromulina tobinii TaxID=1460289 RepID=A0A0M0J4L2_9EUKA|nr:hypothetical protein Ctob_003494 [Chrysochromulina tobinii]|eukprot:KOO21506.1 hypothetical protein Ctob_003494 [Chrysochromulina sp. CCMP291]